MFAEDQASFASQLNVQKHTIYELGAECFAESLASFTSKLDIQKETK
jgi:DNA-binding XRE family transcriptional regulator